MLWRVKPLKCVYVSHRHVTWRLAEGSLSPRPFCPGITSPCSERPCFLLEHPPVFQRQGSAGQPRSHGNCPPSSLCFCLLLPGSQGPSCHWMGCGKTALMSRADISICLPVSSEACKLHQDFIYPPCPTPSPVWPLSAWPCDK